MAAPVASWQIATPGKRVKELGCGPLWLGLPSRYDKSDWQRQGS
jgi:hypothetical protein